MFRTQYKQKYYWEGPSKQQRFWLATDYATCSIHKFHVSLLTVFFCLSRFRLIAENFSLNVRYGLELMCAGHKNYYALKASYSTKTQISYAYLAHFISVRALYRQPICKCTPEGKNVRIGRYDCIINGGNRDKIIVLKMFYLSISPFLPLCWSIARHCTSSNNGWSSNPIFLPRSTVTKCHIVSQPLSVPKRFIPKFWA